MIWLGIVLGCLYAASCVMWLGYAMARWLPDDPFVCWVAVIAGCFGVWPVVVLFEVGSKLRRHND